MPREVFRVYLCPLISQALYAARVGPACFMRDGRSNVRIHAIQPLAVVAVSILSAAMLDAQQSDALSRVFAEIRSGQIEVIDLTHPLDAQSPYWPEGQAASPFHASVAATFEKDGYFARLI